MPDKPSPVKAIRTVGQATVADLTGDLDMNHAPALRDALTTVVARRPQRLVMNLAQVSYIDSTGLGTLVYLLRQVAGYGGKMSLTGVSPNVRNVLEVTRLLTVFTIYETEDEAGA